MPVSNWAARSAFDRSRGSDAATLSAGVGFGECRSFIPLELKALLTVQVEPPSLTPGV